MKRELHAREQIDSSAAAPLESQDQGRWELDIEPWLNRIYHDLLGEQLKDGQWVPDPKKRRVMNELGASEFVSEISNRVSIHTQLSELYDHEIQEFASMAAETYGDKIEDNFESWEIEPTRANFASIAQRLYDILFQMMRIARNGGMKKHRERRNAPQPEQSNQSQQMEGGML